MFAVGEAIVAEAAEATVAARKQEAASASRDGAAGMRVARERGHGALRGRAGRRALEAPPPGLRVRRRVVLRGHGRDLRRRRGAFVARAASRRAPRAPFHQAQRSLRHPGVAGAGDRGERYLAREVGRAGGHRVRRSARRETRETRSREARCASRSAARERGSSSLPTVSNGCGEKTAEINGFWRVFG